MHLPTHPPLGSTFAMRKHGAQNSSTMSGFGRHLLNFLLTFPAEMPAEEAKDDEGRPGQVRQQSMQN